MGTHVYEKEGAVTRGGGRLGSGSAAGREGLAPAGRPPLAPGQREPRTAPWMAGEGALRPLAAGPVPVRSRPPPPPPPPRACLAPFADSGGSVPPRGSFSGLPLPARHLPPVPAPCSCSDTPFCTPSRPQPQPARTRAPSPPRASQSLPAAPAAPSRRPAGVRGRRAARVGRRRGLFHYASPPAPARRACSPERHGAAAFRAGTKERAAQWARRARGHRAPAAASRPCAGVGAPPGERAPGSPPARLLPCSRPHPSMDVAATLPSVCSGAAAAAATARPA